MRRDIVGRMLEGGEDPLYVARRLIVVASEDVGLADHHGLPLVSSFLLSNRCFDTLTT
jgi:replication-associated recombination protein RarA